VLKLKKNSGAKSLSIALVDVPLHAMNAHRAVEIYG